MNQTPDYTFGIASLEIILLLLGSFLLGMLLCWLLRKMGLCCAGRERDGAYGSSGYSPTTPEGGRRQREFPAGQVPSGGYTADINSLLRNREGSPATDAPQPLRAESTPVEVAAAATASAASIAGIGSGHKDDLKKLEGIGPKIEQVLNAAGIQNFEQLAAMTPDQIKPILEAAGGQFRMHDPKSWPYQAELAAKGEWERLKEYQNLLIGGN